MNKQTEAFKRYLDDCDKHAIVPDIAGAFHFAWQEALAQPEQPKVRTGDCLLTGFCASEGHKIQKAEPEQMCRDDGRCQYAIDVGAEGMGHCPKGKCVMSAQPEQEPVAFIDEQGTLRYYKPSDFNQCEYGGLVRLYKEQA